VWVKHAKVGKNKHINIFERVRQMLTWAKKKDITLGLAYANKKKIMLLF